MARHDPVVSNLKAPVLGTGAASKPFASSGVALVPTDPVQALLDENAVLSRELAKAQRCCQCLQASLMRMEAGQRRDRATILAQENALAASKAELTECRGQTPNWVERQKMRARVVSLQLENESLRGQMLALQRCQS